MDRLHNLVDNDLDYAVAKAVEMELRTVDLNTIIKKIETDLELLIEEKKAIIKYNKLRTIGGIDFFNKSIVL